VRTEPQPGRSRPRKRARGRPRKDGSGPFKPRSPTNEELVRDAFEGHAPTLRPVDVVPHADKPDVRRAGGRLPEKLVPYGFPSGQISSGEESGAMDEWRASALQKLEDSNNEQAAVLALEALDRVDRAREKSRNLKGEVGHDFRVSTVVARHAILAMCQRSTRFGVEAETGDAIEKLRSECQQLKSRTNDLKLELGRQKQGRLYLLKRLEELGISPGEPTPAELPEPPPMGRGTKRTIQERRGEAPRSPPRASAAGTGEDPLIPDITMGSPARGEVEPPQDRSLSLMARYAAADPQVMGVLRDIIGSLRGLERRMNALEGRFRPAPAPRRGSGGAVVAAGAPSDRGKRRKRRIPPDQPVDPPSTAPKRVKKPDASARGEPPGPPLTPAVTASGKRRASVVSHKAPPGAAKPPPLATPMSAKRGGR